MLVVEDLRILVIDDNFDAADTFVWLLEAEGYVAEAAYSAQDGLQRNDMLKPHVIFCDLGMPFMSGYEFAQQLRAQETTTYPLLIAVSGWGDERTKKRTENAGFDAHLVKPAKFVDVRDLLKRYTGTTAPRPLC